MPSASVSELKTRLDTYLHRVQAGEEVVITDHGRAIARVVPIYGGGATPAELEHLIQAGIIRPAKRKATKHSLPAPRVADPEGFALKALLQEREEGW